MSETIRQLKRCRCPGHALSLCNLGERAAPGELTHLRANPVSRRRQCGGRLRAAPRWRRKAAVRRRRPSPVSASDPELLLGARASAGRSRRSARRLFAISAGTPGSRPREATRPVAYARPSRMKGRSQCQSSTALSARFARYASSSCGGETGRSRLSRLGIGNRRIRDRGS